MCEPACDSAVWHPWLTPRCAPACGHHCLHTLAQHLSKQVPTLVADAATPFAGPDATPDQAAADTASPQVAQSGHRGLSSLQPNGSGGTGAKAFQRVKDDEWLGKRGSWSNSYADTFGEAGWGAKASATLQQVSLARLCNGLCCTPPQ